MTRSLACLAALAQGETEVDDKDGGEGEESITGSEPRPPASHGVLGSVAEESGLDDPLLPEGRRRNSAHSAAGEWLSLALPLPSHRQPLPHQHSR